MTRPLLMDTMPYFRLFACCRPVRGARRSLLCDLQRQSYIFIPNGLYEILTEHADRTAYDIKAFYGHAYDDAIDAYFSFLVAHEYGFWCDDPSRFPDLDLTWERPEQITQAILDLDDATEYDVAPVLAQLDDLGCKALQVRCFTPGAWGRLAGILEHTRYGRLRSIELMLPYGVAATPDALQALCRAHPRVGRIFVHGAPENRLVLLEAPDVPVHYRTDPVRDPSCCGHVHPGYFVVDLELFTEAQQHNTCLNRKLSVDARGEIRNCPSMPHSFGNVRTVSLHGALAEAGFKDLWTINKDQIEVCKDCEFRYLCTDCRAYLAGPGDRYAKPSKCGYDPYTATWPATKRAEPCLPS